MDHHVNNMNQEADSNHDPHSTKPTLTVSRAAVGRLLRDRTEYVPRFFSFTMLSWNLYTPWSSFIQLTGQLSSQINTKVTSRCSGGTGHHFPCWF